jgi:hypothetical protein
MTHVVLSRAAPLALGLLLASEVASAQTDPKFTFDKPADVKAVEWKAQAKAGALLTSGNSPGRSGALGVSASRKEGNNKLGLEGGLAYGRTYLLNPTYDAADPKMITGFGPRTSLPNTNNWLAKGRYDRFFTTNNSGYASAQAAADKVAGKAFFGGAQVGYSRQLLQDAMNLVVAEIGYDFSYETYVQQTGKTIDPVAIHSARLFVGETLKLSAATGLSASVEALFNVNKESKALSVDTKMPGVDAFKDTRLVGKVALSTTVWRSLSVAFGFTLKYDQNPAPLPVPAGAVGGAAYAATFLPFAETVDTVAEATLIYTFL